MEATMENRLVDELAATRQQLALERAAGRVREQVICMRTSDDLQHVVAMLFREMVTLGVETNGCNITFVDEAADQVIEYLAMENPRRHGISWSAPHLVELDEEVAVAVSAVTIAQAIANWGTIGRGFAIESGEILAEWNRRGTWSAVFDEVDDQGAIDLFGLDRPLPSIEAGNVGTAVAFLHGKVGFREREYSQEHVVMVQALTEALSLGYVRFLDIQRLEQQNHQLILERAVERVRAEALAMRTQDDMLKLVVVLYQEMVQLGVQTNGCNITFIDEEQDYGVDYLAIENPRKHGISWTSPELVEVSADVAVCMREATVSTVFDGEAFADENWRTSEPRRATMTEDIDRAFWEPFGLDMPFEEGWVGEAVYFHYGKVGFRVRENSETHTATVQKLADALSLGFVRFLDFQKVDIARTQGQNGFSGEFVGRSNALRQVQAQLLEVAKTDLTVLILGETGTGKGLAARTLHAASTCEQGPLIHVNCGSLPEQLVESELFGHEKGAFTGAYARKLGKVELAAGGTLFLDEIGDMSLDAQVKLLRLLEERTFERVGGTQTQAANVRVVAATNRDLAQMVAEGVFREDLYYRLQVFPVRLPPLRERVEDIPLLALYFVERMAAHLSKGVVGLAPAALAALRAYGWPGNVRELEHVVQRAVIVCQTATIQTENLLLGLGRGDEHSGSEVLSLEEHERRYICEVLDRVGWVIGGQGGAATLLQLHESTLRNRMKKLGIERP
ncbi:MAG: sigma-54-dependent Fis family transcriptional regulator [Gemmatimonadetes bacterium]|nr:sigma-54-dependent Fis family transcriptional regulator [Gemmatimonadota bacterium]